MKHTDDEKSRNVHYGDESGFTFYGPPVNGFWTDAFAVSDRVVEPLFRSILDRARMMEPAKAPTLVAEWNELSGWTDATGMAELPLVELNELVAALEMLTRSDLSPHVAEFSVTSEECLRCAAALAEFLRSRVDRGLRIYVERD